MPRMKYICVLEGFCGENKRETYNLIYRFLYSWKRTNMITESSMISYIKYITKLCIPYMKNYIYFGGSNLH